MAKNVRKAATQPSSTKVTLDDYARIRNKVLGPTQRQLFPKKSDIVDRKGNLKGDMDVDTLNKLLGVMGAFLNRPKPPQPRVNGKFAKAGTPTASGKAMRKQPSGMSKTSTKPTLGGTSSITPGSLPSVGGITSVSSEPDAALIAALQKQATSPTATLRQRVEAQAAIAALKSTNPAKRKTIQSAAKRAGALHGKLWYEVKYFIEEDALDFSKMSQNSFNEYVKGVINGDFDLTDDELSEMTPGQRKQIEDALGQGSTGDAISSQARKIIEEALR